MQTVRIGSSVGWPWRTVAHAQVRPGRFAPRNDVAFDWATAVAQTALASAAGLARLGASGLRFVFGLCDA